MKKYFLLLNLILAFTLSHCHAQNITGIHTLRIGDKVDKQLVEYELNDESAKNVVWDLRDLSDLDGKQESKGQVPVIPECSAWTNASDGYMTQGQVRVI